VRRITLALAFLTGCVGERVVFIVHDEVVDAVGFNLSDCGVASIEMANPYLAGSGAPIIANIVNTTDTDLECGLTLHILGKQAYADGTTGNVGGGFGGYAGPYPANSTTPSDFDPETGWLATWRGGQWIPGETYRFEACAYAFGVHTADGIDWQPYQVDQDESNRCKSMTFTVAN
jgi:hypothetical protein